MRKHFFALLTLAAIMGSCDVRNKDKIAGSEQMLSGTDTSTVTPATTVQLLDSAFNFGKVKDGEVVEFSYRFKNTGTQPLIISNAVASCGCTVPEKPEAPIKPGEMGYIKVKFNSEGRVGQTHKTVTITSNANPSFPLLNLTGEVIAKNN